MAFFKTGFIFVLLALISTGIGGCARPKPGPLSIYNEQHATTRNESTPPDSAQGNQETADAVNSFHKLVVSLLLDSLDLLPKSVSDKYVDVILKGIEIPVQDDEIKEDVLLSQRKEDIAKVAGLIVQRVYGTMMHEPLIPQTIIFSYEDKVTYADLTVAASKLDSSQNRNMDAYNACLNLLVNSLSGNSKMMQKPKNGLYLRDINNNIYFYREL